MSEESENLNRFKAALTEWAGEAEVYLSSLPNGGQRAYWAQEQWQLDEDGFYRRHVVERLERDRSHVEHLFQFDSYRHLEEAAAASSVVARHLDTAVGTPLSRGLLTLRNLAAVTLPGNQSLLHDRDFATTESRVQWVVEYLVQDEEESTIYSPLNGLSVEGDRLELGPGLTIERMTRMEVERALEYQLITMPMPVPVFRLSDERAFALKRRFMLPKIIGNADFNEDPQSKRAIEDQRRYATEPDELLQCLALMTGERIESPGSLSIRSDRPHGGFGVSLQRRSMGHRFGSDLKLTADQGAELQRLWRLSHDASFPQNKAVALAFRRLALGIQRERAEDRLIDVFIAAEALYLTDGAGEAKDRGELRYRLALRAAVWSEGTMDGWSRREVFRQMKSGYDLRSAVAHGSEPDPKYIKLKSSQVSLQEFVVATEEIVRAGLLKAINQIEPGKRLSILWDDLILPDEPKPASAESNGSGEAQQR